MNGKFRTDKERIDAAKQAAEKKEFDGMCMLSGKTYKVITSTPPPFPETTYGEHAKKLKTYGQDFGPTFGPPEVGKLVARYGISVYLHIFYGYRNVDLDKIVGYSARFKL